MTPPLAHTPEPWTMHQNTKGAGMKIHVEGKVFDFGDIFRLGIFHGDDPIAVMFGRDGETDGKLIVAAPRLLRILGRLASCIKIPAAEDQHTPRFTESDVEVEAAFLEALGILTELHQVRP